MIRHSGEPLLLRGKAITAGPFPSAAAMPGAALGSWQSSLVHADDPERQ